MRVTASAASSGNGSNGRKEPAPTLERTGGRLDGYDPATPALHRGGNATQPRADVENKSRWPARAGPARRSPQQPRQQPQEAIHIRAWRGSFLPRALGQTQLFNDRSTMHCRLVEYILDRIVQLGSIVRVGGRNRRNPGSGCTQNHGMQTCTLSARAASRAYKAARLRKML